MTPRGMTPRMGVAGQTPLRTPARDKLNINQEEDFDAPTSDRLYQVAINCLLLIWLYLEE